MTFNLWDLVSPHRDLRDFTDVTALVIWEDGTRAVACQIGRGRPHSLRWAELPDLDQTSFHALDEGTFHEQAVLPHLPVEGDYEVVVVPTVEWGGSSGPTPEQRRARLPWMIAASLVIAVVMLVTGGTGAGIAALPVAGFVSAMIYSWRSKQGSTRILTAGDLTLDGSNLLDYTLARQQGLRPALPTDDRRRRTALTRCADIRAEYGALSSDIAYRIENSALFDSAVPTTSEFLQAMVRFENGVAELGVDDVEELAVELEISFATAKDHAETVGWAHLPTTARPDARRAAKAARLASSAGTDGERTAALTQVIRILDSLALYYLPGHDVVRGELTTGPPRE